MWCTLPEGTDMSCGKRIQVLENGIPVAACATWDEADDAYARCECDECREVEDRQ